MKNAYQLAQMERIYSEWLRITGHGASAGSRLADVRRFVSDALLLECIAWFDDNGHVQRLALEKLGNEAVAKDIAVHAPNDTARASAARSVCDQAALRRLYETDAAQCVRCAALERIADQTLVQEVAQDATSHVDIRAAAVSSLTDPALIRTFTAPEQPSLLRVAAFHNPCLNDQELFTCVARYDENPNYFVNLEAREAAAARITSLAAALKIMRDESLPRQIRCSAMEGLDDEALETLASTEFEPGYGLDKADVYRFFAAQRIRDPAVRERVALHAAFEGSRITAAEFCQEPEVLRRIIAHVGKPKRYRNYQVEGEGDGDANGLVRAAAAERVRDQALLCELALSDIDFMVRFKAQYLVDAPDVLERVIQTEPHPKLRERAEKLLKALIARLRGEAELSEFIRSCTGL